MANVPAYPNFKATIISKKILQELRGNLQALNFTNNEYEGEVGLGKTVRILGVLRPTVYTYEQGTDINAPENVKDHSQDLVIDQFRYTNVGVDDIDKASTDIKIMNELTTATADALADNVDAYVMQIAGLHTLGSASTAVTDGTGVLALVDAGLTVLYQNKVTLKETLALVLEPRTFGFVQTKLMALSTDNVDAIKRGVFGMYRNIEVMMSNNVYNNGTDDCCPLTTKKAIAFVDGLDITEPYRPEKQFKDAVKTLYTFGCKVVRPKELYVIHTK